MDKEQRRQYDKDNRVNPMKVNPIPFKLMTYCNSSKLLLCYESGKNYIWLFYNWEPRICAATALNCYCNSTISRVIQCWSLVGTGSWELCLPLCVLRRGFFFFRKLYCGIKIAFARGCNYDSSQESRLGQLITQFNFIFKDITFSTIRLGLQWSSA